MKTGIINSVRFLNTFSSALVMGIVFGVWMGFNPFRLSASAYIEQQQNLILSLNELMPILGLATIIIALLSAYAQRENTTAALCLIIAALLFIATGLITRFGNQVINAEMINWDSQNPPANWTEFRDRWWKLHSIRTGTALVGLVIVTIINTRIILLVDSKKVASTR